MYKPLIPAVAVAALLTVAGCQSSSGGGSASSPSSSGTKATSAPSGPAHSEDVTIASCAPDEAGFAAAQVTITNHSSKPSNYIVTITFESADGKTQIGTGLDSVNGLNPGQQNTQSASSLQTAQPGFTCRVSDITRYAA